MLADPPANTL
ncbi:hypothetical protein YPPY25_0585, partial [Yersinia pestis PY-25]